MIANLFMPVTQNMETLALVENPATSLIHSVGHSDHACHSNYACHSDHAGHSHYACHFDHAGHSHHVERQSKPLHAVFFKHMRSSFLMKNLVKLIFPTAVDFP